MDSVDSCVTRRGALTGMGRMGGDEKIENRTGGRTVGRFIGSFALLSGEFKRRNQD